MRLRGRACLILLIGWFAVIPNLDLSAETPSAEAEVRSALDIFLAAFENLDWPSFRACFDRDATMFHPAAPNERRIDTPEQFDAAWHAVFERIRKVSGRNSAPFMKLEPKDLRIAMVSPDVAVATFHLYNPNEIDRRTIVFKKTGEVWKIVHIHASNLHTTNARP